MVNYIKSRPLKLRLFYQICEEMDAHFKTRLLQTQVHWLSRGCMLCCIFELKDIMLKFFKENHQHEFCNLIQNQAWCDKLAYLSDIFEHLNKFNTCIQGRAENILSIEKICTTRDKIKIWKCKVKERNFEMFPKLCYCELKLQMSSQIINHLALLGEELQNYFPNIKSKNYDLIRIHFLHWHLLTCHLLKNS